MKVHMVPARGPKLHGRSKGRLSLEHTSAGFWHASVPCASISKVSAVTSALPLRLQAPGGAAGEHEKECDGEWPLAVSALR